MTRVLAVTLGLMVSIAAAPDGADQAVTMGVGNDSCGSWTANRKAHGVREVADISWVVGYLSAAATWGHVNPLKGTDAEGVWAWMDNYCRAHPLTNIIDAASAFVHERIDR
jgi:hypothetical protein